MSRKLLLLASLTACGAPGADSVFTRGNPKSGAVDSAQPKAAPGPARARIEPKPHRGMYKRDGERSLFQPCGTKVALNVVGTGEGRFLLRERYRFGAVWQGSPMYSILVGAIITDTVKPSGRGADTGTVKTEREFFIIGVDSMRTWHSSDCGGMRIDP